MDMDTVMKSLEDSSKDGKVKFVSDKGKNSCDKCLQYDGKIFDIDDPNLPRLPIHPHCRCKYVSVSNSNKDVSKDVEQYRIAQILKETHKRQDEEAQSLAEQVIKARDENSKLREQKIFLIFNGRYLMSSDGKLLVDAVSGKAVSENATINHATVAGFISETVDREFDYSYSRQGEQNIGGIPQGLYHIEAKEERSARTSPWSHIIKSSGWGDYSWSLHPDKDTDTRKRGGFFIHGGSDFGSAGCIDLQKNDSVFKKYFDSTGLPSIYVYVNYENVDVRTQERKYKVYPVMPRHY